MIRLFYLFILALTTVGTSLAQTKLSLKGYLVTRGEETAIVNATICVNTHEGQVLSTLTSEQGYFEISSQSPIKSISAEYLGQHYQLNLPTISSTIEATKFYIDIPATTLKEVEVHVVRPMLRYDGSKAIYNLGAFSGLKGSGLLEALGRIPNLHYNEGQGFLLNGFEKLYILIDRRPLRMSASELEAYLSNMPTVDIASVELIANPTPDYGSNGLPVLNIITKRQLEDGYNAFIAGRLRSQYYISEVLGARLNLNKGISRSYLSYNFSDNRSRETTELQGLSTSNVVVRPRRAHSMGLGTLLRLTNSQALDVNLYGTLQSERYNYGLVGNDSKLTRPHLSTSLQHSYQSDKVEIRTTLEGAWASLRQAYKIGTPIDIEDRTSYYRLSPTLTYRLSKKSSLIGGGSYDVTTYLSDYHPTNTAFNYDERKMMVFIGYNHNFGLLSLQTNIEGNWYSSISKQNNKEDKQQAFIWLPKITLGGQLSKEHYLAFELRSKYIRPDFRDITPISTTYTTSWAREGNMNLQSALTYDFSLRYSFLQAAQLEFSYSDTNSPIVEQLVKLQSGSISLNKINLDYSRYFRALTVLPIPLARTKAFSWITTTVGAVQRQWDKGTVFGQAYDNQFTTYYLQHKHDITFASSWTLGLSATFYGPLYYGLYRMERTWWAEMNLAKSIGSWRITASIKDPWNSNTARGTFNSPNMPISFKRDWHRPEVLLTVSYSFGNKKLNSYRSRQSEDATRRMRAEGNESMARGVGNN